MDFWCFLGFGVLGIFGFGARHRVQGFECSKVLGLRF